MGIIAILSSPSSFRDNDEMEKIRDVISKGSGIFHYEVEKHKDIAEALTRFQQAAVEAIVIVGDRALASATFEHIVEKDLAGVKDIPLAVLPAGDNNIVAENLGAVHSEPHVALKKLLADFNKSLLKDRVAEYPLIKLEGVRGLDYLYGLFFCAGEITRQKRLFHRPVSEKGVISRLRRWIDTLLMIQSAYRNAMGKNRLEDAIRINRNQRGAVVGHFFILLVTTLDTAFNRIALRTHNGPDSACFLSVENTPEAVLKTGKKMLAGKYEGGEIMAGHVMTDIKHARIVLKAPFVLDGSYYQAGESGELFVSVTDRLKFIRLS